MKYTKLKTYLVAFIVATLSSLFAVSAAFAAGTSVSSGFSFSIGNSHTSVTEWSDYSSFGCGVSVSYDSNSDGFDYRRDTYNTQTVRTSNTDGSIYGEFTELAHTSSAGILRSSTGIREGFSVSSMETESYGETHVYGNYVQVSRQDGAYNREYGQFESHNGYEADSYQDSLTVYQSTYASTEFDY